MATAEFRAEHTAHARYTGLTRAVQIEIEILTWLILKLIITFTAETPLTGDPALSQYFRVIQEVSIQIQSQTQLHF